MERLPPVKMTECSEIVYCYHCGVTIYTDRYWDEVLGWDWSGTCPNCCNDALGRDRKIEEVVDGQPAS